MHFRRNAGRNSTRFRLAIFGIALEERALTAPRFFLDQPTFRGISSFAGDSLVSPAQAEDSTTNVSIAGISANYSWTNPYPSNASGSDSSQVNTNFRSANGEASSDGAGAIVISNWLENVNTITTSSRGPGVPYHYNSSTAQSGNLANPEAPINWNIEDNSTSPPSPYQGAVIIQGQFKIQAQGPTDGSGNNYITDLSAFLIDFHARVTIPGQAPLIEVDATTNGSTGDVTVNYNNPTGQHTDVLPQFGGVPGHNLPTGSYAINWQVTIPAGEAQGAQEVIYYKDTLLTRYADGNVDSTDTQGKLDFTVTSIT